MTELVQKLICIAGLAHVFLCLGSLFIPKLLEWKKNVASLPNLLRQMFWVYSGYTLMTNLFFGVISILSYQQLLDQSIESTSLTGFIALYWIGRVLIQFTYFDRKSVPRGTIYVAGEFALNTLFIFFTAVYSVAFYLNFRS